MPFFRYYLWVAPHILIVIVLALSLRRSLHRTLSLFVAYLLFELVQFAALLTLFTLGSPSQNYHRIFVLGLGVSSLIKLGLVYQLSGKFRVTRPIALLQTRSVLRFVFVVLLLVAAAASAMLPETGLERVRYVFHVADFSSNIVLTGLLCTLLAMARLLGLSWRSHFFGVVLGFGIFAATALACAAVRVAFDRSVSVVIDDVQMAAYHVCVLIWLIYLIRPESGPSLRGGGLSKRDIEFWDEQLRRVVDR